MHWWQRLSVCLVLLASCSGESVPDKADVQPQRATIEGVVLEQGSEVPIANVSVFLVRTSDQPQIRTNTGSDGRFTLEGLDAGRHLVALVREGYVVPGRLEISGYPFRVTTGQRVSGVVFHLLPTGTISGRILGPEGKPAHSVEVQLLQNVYLMGREQWSVVNRGGTAKQTRVETNERGEFRAVGVDPGRYVLRFVPHEATIESVIPGGKSPGPILYPGVHDVSKATIIEVKPGRETLLEDLKLVSQIRRWIRVVVLNESGEPLQGFGNWRVEPVGWIGSDYPFVEQRIISSKEIQPDLPGTYDITAIWPSPAGSLAGRLRVNYQGADIDAKMIIHKAQGKLTGRVMLQEKEGVAPAPLAGAEVAIGPDIPYFIRSGPDGMLSLPAIYSGRYRLGAVRGLPENTFAARVSQGSRDLYREDLVVEKGETVLDVVVSPGAGVLEGKVVDAAGKPVHNAIVALIPEGALKARVDYYGAYQSVRTDQNGAFDIRGITPGSYQAYAWSDAPAGGYRSDAFMKAYAGKGSPVKLDLGSSVKLELITLDVTP
jgi:5-hydroxyisourate hydrolase-like protein (transthyretin family)